MSKWNVMYTHSPFETVAKGTATVVGPEHKVRFEGPNAIHMAEGYASFKNNGPTVKIVPVEPFRVPFTTFEMELKKLINRFSVENVSDTPDSILAKFLMSALAAFNTATTKERRAWYSMGASLISIQKRINDWVDLRDDFFKRTVPKK